VAAQCVGSIRWRWSGPAELVRFDPADWGGATFYAWQKWLHARADFADEHDLEHVAVDGVVLEVIPYDVPADVWRAVVDSLS
jgi:hypothetical protein